MSEEHASQRTDDVSTTTDDDRGDGPVSLSGDLTRYVNYVALAALVVLALVAGLQFYTAVGQTINEWVVREYRPLFRAAFNLAVLLVAFAGISWQIRRVTTE
ncbi:hypothetical protein [Halobaculum limi]|uniref:hypothetical protein n=1 Tax=Halobaculum limi TaxID=3031916 RepID=UPI002406DB71|nr:hypothetical protein [Halobaculum sp. YSMS11]